MRSCLRLLASGRPSGNLRKLSPQADTAEELNAKARMQREQEESVQAEVDALKKKFNIKPKDPAVTTEFNPVKAAAESGVAKKLGISDFQAEKNAKAEAFIKRQAESSELPSDVRQMQESLRQERPREHLLRHYHSEFFLNVWDPILRNNDLETSLSASGLSLEALDVIGTNVKGDTVNLRKFATGTNKVTLVVLSSSAATTQIAQQLQHVWMQQFGNTMEHNADGVIVCRSAMLMLVEGFLARLFHKAIRGGVDNNTPENLKDGTLVFFPKSEDEPIARVRRFLGALNRFVVHAYLVDAQGRTRWSAKTGKLEENPHFLTSLERVTKDLIQETKYKEAE